MRLQTFARYIGTVRGTTVLKEDTLFNYVRMMLLVILVIGRLTLGKDDMLNIACWRDIIGLSNHALCLSASNPLTWFLEARPT